MKERFVWLLPLAAIAALTLANGCGDDDDDLPGTQGSAGASGTGGRAGTGGSGTGGSGTGGSGTGGSGTGGSGTAGSGTGGSGTAGSGTAGSGTAGSGTAGQGGGGQGGGGQGGAPNVPVVDVLALGANNTLYSFKSNAPGEAKSVSVTGVVSGTLEGIDVRPSDGKLYGLTSDQTLYTIATATAPQLTAAASGGKALGTAGVVKGSVGFDFNPASAVPAETGGGNALRLINYADASNYRVNPNNGAIAGTDKSLAYQEGDVNAGKAPAVAAAGYTKSFAGTTATLLYDIDAATDYLVVQNPPNDGTLSSAPGPLGVDVGELAGFDIVTIGTPPAQVDHGFLVSGARLYYVDLTTGAAADLGAVAGASGLRGLVVTAAP
ncbi:MAG TPA: DUF4394 domain-containing protein [Polyangiaceae bacterium]|nr:DUF4394 domain-containing protein [Polyangiaceae bacterium]